MPNKLSYGSDIPGARQDLTDVANALMGISLLLENLGMCAFAEKVSEQERKIRDTVQGKMTRKFNGRCAPKKAGLPTVDQVQRALIYLKDGQLHQQDIARKVGINSGRVSEILNGLIYIDGNEVKRRLRVDNEQDAA